MINIYSVLFKKYGTMPTQIDRESPVDFFRMVYDLEPAEEPDYFSLGL